MHFNIQLLDALTVVLDPLLAIGFLIAAYSLSLAGGLIFMLSAAYQLKAQQKQGNKNSSSV